MYEMTTGFEYTMNQILYWGTINAFLYFCYHNRTVRIFGFLVVGLIFFAGFVKSFITTGMWLGIGKDMAYALVVSIACIAGNFKDKITFFELLLGKRFEEWKDQKLSNHKIKESDKEVGKKFIADSLVKKNYIQDEQKINQLDKQTIGNMQNHDSSFKHKARSWFLDEPAVGIFISISFVVILVIFLNILDTPVWLFWMIILAVIIYLNDLLYSKIDQKKDSVKKDNN